MREMRRERRMSATEVASMRISWWWLWWWRRDGGAAVEGGDGGGRDGMIVIMKGEC